MVLEAKAVSDAVDLRSSLFSSLAMFTLKHKSLLINIEPPRRFPYVLCEFFVDYLGSVSKASVANLIGGILCE